MGDHHPQHLQPRRTERSTRHLHNLDILQQPQNTGVSSCADCIQQTSTLVLQMWCLGPAVVLILERLCEYVVWYYHKSDDMHFDQEVHFQHFLHSSP